jgi:hypothetical protein
MESYFRQRCEEMLITERYKEKIYGVISCYDRIVIQGVIPGW